MFISKLSCLLDAIPAAIDHTYPVFLTCLQILFRNSLFPERAQHDSSKFLFFVFDIGEQFEALHLFSSAFFSITLLEIYHEKWDGCFRRLYFLPFACCLFALLSIFIYLLLLLVVAMMMLMLFALKIDIFYFVLNFLYFFMFLLLIVHLKLFIINNKLV